MRGGKRRGLTGLLALALALAACGGGESDRRVAASGDAASETADTTETTEAPTTTALPPTTVAAPPVVARPTVTAPAVTVPKVKLPITTTTAKPKAVMSPLEPGTARWGHADLGIHRVVVQGPTKLDFGIYHSDAYDREFTETMLEVHDQGVVRYAHVDFGDGTTWEQNFSYSCNPQSAPYPKPNPIFLQSGWRYYAAPGAYTVTATVKTVRCTEWGPDGQEIEPNTIVTTLVAHRHAGARPQ